jgi:ribosomal protein L29
MASKPMRPKDRQELRKHIVALRAELTRLLSMLD